MSAAALEEARRPVSRAGEYACSLVPAAQLFKLQAEWDDLHAATPGAHVSDSHAWARLMLAHGESAGGRRAACAVVRRSGEVIAILPLVVLRSGVVRLGRTLNSQTSEYAAFLVRPGVDLEAVWRSIAEALAGEIDALHLHNVREDGPLALCLRHAGAAELHGEQSSFVRRGDFPDFDAYLDAVDLRRRLTKWTRLLSRDQPLEFAEVSAAERRAVLAWMIANKRAWLRERGLVDEWFFDETYERLMHASLEELGPSGARRIFCLRAGGEVIAAELCSIDRTRVEAFLATFSEAFAKWSPGFVVTGNVIGWAFERGLDYDFRLGAALFKQAWANQFGRVTCYALPLSSSGQLFLAYARARRLAARTLRPQARRMVPAGQGAAQVREAAR